MSLTYRGVNLGAGTNDVAVGRRVHMDGNQELVAVGIHPCDRRGPKTAESRQWGLRRLAVCQKSAVAKTRPWLGIGTGRGIARHSD